MSPKEGSQIKRESTSIKIDHDLWKQAKIEAINRDVDLSDLVEHALRNEIGGKEKGGKL
jgi:post-segregation antitoxin (ccd killing protein)